MFTGLIETLGEIADVRESESGRRVRVRSRLGAELRPGDSLAVNGVCLTVVSAGSDYVDADIGPQTAALTTLGSLRIGSVVNLERPMRSDGRFGGHFVQGHVDATGVIARIRDDAEAHWLTVSFGEDLGPYFVERGSVAVDGISLTVAGLHESAFDVMIIPFTWSHTNLHALRAGDRVNLECDIIGKYVARAMEIARATTRTL